MYFISGIIDDIEKSIQLNVINRVCAKNIKLLDKSDDYILLHQQNIELNEQNIELRGEFSHKGIKKEKPIHKKEKDSLLKMVAGLLACNYGNDSTKNNDVKAREISGDILKNTGIDITDETVRKYLRQAQDFLQLDLDD